MAPSPPPARQAGRVPGWLASALLVVCVFAPYGTFAAGEGTLRLDHVAVWGVLGVAISAGLLARPPPLVLGLLAFVAWTLAATALHADLFLRSPLGALKTLDGILRGPVVLWIMASLRPDASDRRLLVRTISVVAVALAVMALAERLLPMDAAPIAWLADRYGGPVPNFGPFQLLGMNHKQMCLAQNRASAVFVTAPSLAFAAVFFVVLTATVGDVLDRKSRIVLFASAAAAGLASNSKSFFLGLAVFLLWSWMEGRREIRLGLTLALVACAFALPWALADRTSEQWKAVEDVRGSQAAEDPMDALTAGRITQSGSLFDVGAVVLSESPLVGYGLGQRDGLAYADNGFNTFLLGGGLLGLLSALAGVALQLAWLRARRASHFAAMGAHTLVLGVAFFMAGAIFQMPKINDLLFTILGLSIAAAGALEPSRASGQPIRLVPSSAGVR